MELNNMKLVKENGNGRGAGIQCTYEAVIKIYEQGDDTQKVMLDYSDYKEVDYIPLEKDKADRQTTNKKMEDFNMSKLSGNDLMEDMEFLVNELHKEWDRSGTTRATVIIGINEATEVNQTLATKIIERQELIEKDDLSFKQSIDLSKENYVLFRLVKKIKAKEDTTNKKGLDMEFAVPLDKEEFELFKCMFSAKLV